MLKSFFKNLLFECTQFFFYTFTSKEKFLYKNNFNILRSLLVYGILTLIGIGLMFVMSKILVYFNVPFIKPDICNVSNNETNPIIYPWYYILIVGSILAPIFEEIAFRLPIIYRKNNLIFSILALYVSLVFINKTSAYKIFFELDFDYLLNRLIRLFNFNIIILCLILVSLILSISKQNKIIQNFWNRNTFIFYFCFCISFGLMHNQTSLFTNPLWALMQSLPFLFSSFYLGYIRITYGIKYSIILHIGWNGMLTIISFIFDF